MNTNPRRFEDSPFHEDDYREEILEYMQNMDVRFSISSAGAIDVTTGSISRIRRPHGYATGITMVYAAIPHRLSYRGPHAISPSS